MLLRSLWALTRKEVLTLVRDPGALLLALVTPLLLTLIIGAAFAGDTGPTHIPVLLLTQDDSPLAEAFIQTFYDPELAELLAPERVTDEGAARSRVAADEAAALVIVPQGYGEALFPQQKLVQEALGLDLYQPDIAQEIEKRPVEQKMRLLTLLNQTSPRPPLELRIYSSPERPVSSFIIQAVARRALETTQIRLHGTRILMEELTRTLPPQVWETQGTLLSERLQQTQEDVTLPIVLESRLPSGRPFRWVDYIASSMAVLFLMFTVTAAGRTLLAERERGTLTRLLLTPTPAWLLLAGKLSGNLLSGLLQMLVLWGATTLIGAWWGPPLLVLLCILILVPCATGVGALIAAWARTPAQAGLSGIAFSLIGAALAGSFLPRENLPETLRYLSLVTPHAWGIELFTALHLGANLRELLPLLAGTLTLGLVYYGLALPGFRRQFS